MSTTQLRKSLSTSRTQHIKIFSVNIKTNEKQESLGEYVKRKRNEGGLSILDVEKRSRFGGSKGISNGYITQIENGDITNVSPDKLKALAKGLAVPINEIFTIAGINLNNQNPVLDEVLGFFSGFEDLDIDEREEFRPSLVMIANDIRRRLLNKKRGDK